MTQEQFLVQVAEFLDAAGIPYMVAGSHGSSYHGLPRTTYDVDFVVDPSSDQLEAFLVLLGNQFYVSLEGAREALGKRAMFNIIDFKTGSKADLIVRKDRPFSVEEFSRRQQGVLHGTAVTIVSAEDVILSKLEWNKITPSERQVRDALNVVKVKGPALDLDYLRKWAADLGVSEKLQEVLRDAGQ
jgi:predicted nucleotidyltransferase